VNAKGLKPAGLKCELLLCSPHSIWNTGPGMDAAELKAATDLACEINKSLGLDENFGVGAKVSSLSSNKHGMRFRWCKAGRVR